MSLGAFLIAVIVLLIGILWELMKIHEMMEKEFACLSEIRAALESIFGPK